MGRTVILSPHLDDAVFSCWSLLACGRASVITVCAGVPSSRTHPAHYDRLSGSRSPRERMLERRAEDTVALQMVGASYVHLDVLDAPYRRRRVDPAAVAEEVEARVAHDAEVVGPAAIGGHPDHVLTREVALTLRARGRSVCLFADVPYASRYGWPAWVTGERVSRYLDVDADWERWLGGIAGRHLLAPEVHLLERAEQRRKLAAMRVYRTQYPAIEEGPSRRLSHAHRIPFEVTWGFCDGL